MSTHAATLSSPCLAFDTSTEQMSIALSAGDRCWTHTGAGGAQASAHLIPAIMGLLHDAGLRVDQLDAIAFGRGPGSFTGLRTACAVAQGLGLGAEAHGRAATLLPMDTLLVMAEEARYQSGLRQIVVVLDARMDEVYTAPYDFDAGGRWFDAPAQVHKPDLVHTPPGWALAGNAFAAYGDRLARSAGQARLEVLPTASAMLRLVPLLLAAGAGVPADAALPSYIRDKVASTSAERAAARAASLHNP